jgi:hypothetical protein
LALRLPVLGVAVCLLRRAGFEYSKEVIGNCTAGVITLRLRQWIGISVRPGPAGRRGMEVAIPS